MVKPRKPMWWQIDSVVIGAALLLWREGSMHLAEPLHKIVLIGIVLLVHGLIVWWLQANQLALATNNQRNSAEHTMARRGGATRRECR